jgi:hypothetical protein
VFLVGCPLASELLCTSRLRRVKQPPSAHQLPAEQTLQDEQAPLNKPTSRTEHTPDTDRVPSHEHGYNPLLRTRGRVREILEAGRVRDSTKLQESGIGRH